MNHPQDPSGRDLDASGADDDSRERRHQDRRPVDIFINRFINGYPYLCQALDVSTAGMRLRPLHEPHLHAGAAPRFMGLQFQLPGVNEVLTASGEAVRGTEGEVGVRFTSLSPDSRAAIEKFLMAA